MPPINSLPSSSCSNLIGEKARNTCFADQIKEQLEAVRDQAKKVNDQIGNNRESTDEFIMLPAKDPEQQRQEKEDSKIVQPRMSIFSNKGKVLFQKPTSVPLECKELEDKSIVCENNLGAEKSQAFKTTVGRVTYHETALRLPTFTKPLLNELGSLTKSSDTFLDLNFCFDTKSGIDIDEAPFSAEEVLQQCMIEE